LIEQLNGLINVKNCFLKFPLIAIALFSLSIVVNSQTKIPAFPGAEGSGANSVGGRFGSVYLVTNLNTDGAGSFKDAISKPNRIIIFTVSGILQYNGDNLNIDNDNLTIAGQTAPGDGICIKRTSVHVGGKDVIIRYIRSRVGYTTENGKPKHRDGFSIDIDGGENIIVDHISVSWATDENLTHANDTKAVTVQNCFIAEGLNYFDPDNQPNRHGFGSIIGSDLAEEVNYHHNLYAHHEKRSPRFASRGGLRNLVDFRNNVIYDCYNETGLNNPDDSINANYIGNFLKYGPNTPDNLKYQLFNIRGKYIRMYAAQNYVYGNPERTLDNWKAMIYDDGASPIISKVNSPFQTSFLTTESAETVYNSVLDQGGAIFPSRDLNDSRIVEDVANGTGKMIEYETDLSSNPWGEYYSLPYPQDTDKDGIPDFWEDQFGLDKNNSSDNMNISAGGYANIEHYINNTDPTGNSYSIVYVGGYKSRSYEDGLKEGSFRIYRTGNNYNSLSIKYSVSGDASPDIDYQKLSGEAFIPAGASYVEIPITPILDLAIETDEKVVITLTPSQDGYKIGCPSQTLIVIKDQSSAMGINDFKNTFPKEFKLGNNYPNPFNSDTIITYSVAKNQPVKLEVYDLLGRCVKNLVNGVKQPGSYQVRWDGTDNLGHVLSSGIYFYRMISNFASQAHKMMLLE
jgi:hypothetical protein